MRRFSTFIGLMVALSACSGDPLRGVARLSDLSTTQGAASVAAAPVEANQGGGLFARLLNRAPQDPTNAAVEAALAEVGAVADTPAAAPVSDAPEAPVVQTTAAVESDQGGLFGLFRRNRTPSTPVDTAQANEAAAELDVTVAASDPEIINASVVAPAPAPRRGLAALFGRAPDAAPPQRTGPDAEEVPAGTVLPFGQIARVCGLRSSERGRQISNAAGFAIYDTLPSARSPRPFYILGFDDGCARTFTGAVVVPGNIQTHEFVRYQPSNERIEYTQVDNAYEALKASVCRVGRGQPCTSRADRLNRNTQFITVYSFFGGTFSSVPTEWAQILIHDGQVLGVSLKDG